jgi:hypothetical protein
MNPGPNANPTHSAQATIGVPDPCIGGTMGEHSGNVHSRGVRTGASACGPAFVENSFNCASIHARDNETLRNYGMKKCESINVSLERFQLGPVWRSHRFGRHASHAFEDSWGAIQVANKTCHLPRSSPETMVLTSNNAIPSPRTTNYCSSVYPLAIPLRPSSSAEGSSSPYRISRPLKCRLDK